MSKIKRIAVILGGTSSEREISLNSGEAVYRALKENGHEVFKIDPQDNNSFKEIMDLKPDLAFIVLHGLGGEDGRFQGFLDSVGIAHTGSSVEASALTMNKAYTQSILRDQGFRVPDFMVISKKNYQEKGFDFFLKEVKEKIGFPCLVKAPSQGSSLGIYFINKETKEKSLVEQLRIGMEEAFKLEDMILVEKMIAPSTEITVAVLGNSRAISLPTIEITTVTGYYDYETKYTEGMCQHIIPARLPLKVREKARKIAEEAYELFRCSGFARIDFMVQDEEPYIIDINTIPGFTKMSLVPDTAQHVGISFNQLVEFIKDMALGEEFPLELYTNSLKEV